MSNSFFFLQAEKNQKNRNFFDQIEARCIRNSEQAYLISRPLGDNKYSYKFNDGVVLLCPKHKITFVNFSKNNEDFLNYVDEFIEDLGSISDKYRYKEAIGRPRAWKDLIETFDFDDKSSIEDLLASTAISSVERQRVCELLISLLTGSINDIDKVKADVPTTLLEQVKNKILLFDGDQTRFVYQPPTKSTIRIQGLSGTGKTELLLHKLKEIYVSYPDSRIAFTCHNRILADNLRRRIPEFFDFMKVEQQIQWNDRLWCTHAWGSQSDIHSGIYRYICGKYDVQFHRYSPSMSFDKACALAADAISAMREKVFAFDFMLIDESQDFPESFFRLCQLVTRDTVYIAGDVFQGIFDEKITLSITPDYLLSKCYRTDPRTLMFAHSLGMGLFEEKKLRWLEDPEWKACGYIVEKQRVSPTYRLKREPLRRFEDIDRANVPSVKLIKTNGNFYKSAGEQVLACIQEIRAENPTAGPEDVGVILMDLTNTAYALADQLEDLVPRSTGWKVNKAHESKRRIKDELFVSNRNHVKGLEFPFVICVAERISNRYAYRNALYMTMTRSFIQTYLILSDDYNAKLLPSIEAGLKNINQNGFIEADAPSEAEKREISTTIEYSEASLSFFDMANQIFDELDVLPIFRENLQEAARKVFADEFDYENLRETIEFNYKKMLGE